MLSFLPTPMATETARNLNESTATPAGSEAVLLILVAASFSHLLNDTIQSLIPDLSGAQRFVSTQLRPNRSDYAHFPGDRFVATASRGPVYRPSTAVIFLGYRESLF